MKCSQSTLTSMYITWTYQASNDWVGRQAKRRGMQVIASADKGN